MSPVIFVTCSVLFLWLILAFCWTAQVCSQALWWTARDPVELTSAPWLTVPGNVQYQFKNYNNNKFKQLFFCCCCHIHIIIIIIIISDISCFFLILICSITTLDHWPELAGGSVAAPAWCWLVRFAFWQRETDSGPKLLRWMCQI